MKRLTMTFVLASLFLSLLTINSTAFAKSSEALSIMLKKTMPAVVNIYAEGDSKNAQNPFADAEFGPHRTQRDNHFVSIGSGVIINASKGYIVTNAHVVYNADNITVTLNDGRRYKAKPIGMDTSFDIAVLQINAQHLTAIPLGNSNELQVGDAVSTIGSPFNLKQTVTSGIVSALHRSIHIERNEDFIQTDAAINVGSSGGAMIDSQGQLVGINTAILAPDGGNIGIGFAIPINLVKNVASQLIKHGKLERGLLGVLIQDLTPDLADSFGEPNAKGALISNVNRFSPAAKAGLKAGDIIIAVDGKAVSNSTTVRNQVSLMRPGTAVALGILRHDKKLTIHAKVVSQKTFAAHMAQANASLLAGVSLSNFNQITLNHGHVRGVQADYVNQNSDAWASMLRPGDVITSANRQTVENIKGLEKIVSHAQKHLLLHVLRGNGAFYLVIP